MPGRIFKKGSYVRGTFNTALAVTDVFVMKAAAVAVGKIAFKTAGRSAAKASGRVFWSGGNAAKNTAAGFAKSNGMKTLEMTKKGLSHECVKSYFTSFSIKSNLEKPFHKFCKRG